MARIISFKPGCDGPSEFAYRTLDGLVRIPGAIFDDDRIPTSQPCLQRALNLVRTGFDVTFFIGEMSLDPCDVFAEMSQCVLHDRCQVIGHQATPVNMRIGVQQNLHGYFSSRCAEYA